MMKDVLISQIGKTGQDKKAIRKILLVEDSEPDAVYAKRNLEKAFDNVEVTIARSLGEAFHLYKIDFFHLVLLDLNLPDAFGAQTVTEMRRFNKSVPIVVMTGMDPEYIKKPVLQNGANRLIEKSHLHEDFLKSKLQALLA